MSVNYYAYAVIGVTFQASDLEGATIPSCEHPEREGNTFCPVCGKRVEDHVEDFDGPEIEAKLPDGFVVRTSYSDYDDTVLVGYGISTEIESGSDHNWIQLPRPDWVRECLKKALGDEIYDEETFGLHVYGRAS